MEEEESKEIIFEVVEEEQKYSNTVRVQKKDRKREKTTLVINKAVQGDSIETMLERLKEGEGVDSVQDRDLVYNDGESSTVNPITNIRSDRFELMLEEKQGEYEHKHKPKMKVVKDEEVVPEEKLNPTEGEQKAE